MQVRLCLNPSTCTCKFHKESEFDEHLENYTYIKKYFDKLMTAYGQIVNETK